ncbi:MAG: malate synthase A [SAR324 cluster bacterium]|nr:malate synthase A [SAR324 cluster bacterium]
MSSPIQQSESTQSERPNILGVEINPRAISEDTKRVLVGDVLGLVGELHRKFEPARQALLKARAEWQARIDQGGLPEYPSRNSEAVTGNWRVAPIPEDLRCRRVEITGPVNSAKMVINMLSRGANGVRADTAMVDFEDAMKPTWDNLMSGIVNLIGAAEGSLTHVEPAANGKAEKIYRLDPEDMAVIIVRPRGLHLDEANLTVDGAPVSGALLDTAMSFYHTAHRLTERGKTPAYYIPKTEHAAEARWWNDLFIALQDALGFPVGTIKATFLIETLPAAYEMEEILYEAREHAVGLNVGRWDKIFSDIKTFRNHPDRVLADRASISMQQPWMESYAKRCVHVCHSRGAYAMGGMAAFTPGKTPELREQQTAKVLADKQWEFGLGHDGCWVSHPYFIAPAMEAFTREQQTGVLYSEAERYPEMLPQPIGPKTLDGLRTNVRVGIAYLNGWRQGIGCVSWDNLMEDLATLEISRTQTWQWLRYAIALDDGTEVTEALVRQVFAEELGKIIAELRREMAGAPQEAVDVAVEGFQEAAAEAEAVFTRAELTDFLTLTSERV